MKNLTLVWEARVFLTVHPQQALQEKSKECCHNLHPEKQKLKPYCLKKSSNSTILNKSKTKYKN